MFTGLVEQTGVILRMYANRMTVRPEHPFTDPVIGESIAVNGCCLTAERFFDDNGRFEIYKKGLEKFLNHPILGAGFMDSHGISSVPDHRYHNTIVQILASCGTVGILAYAFHRFNTISLIIKKKSGRNNFLAFCLLGLILTSLFDIHFFNIYPAFYYVLILIAIEKSN